MKWPYLEALESRQMFSLVVPTVSDNLVLIGSPISTTSAPTGVTLSGTTINAETNQQFRAVVGTIGGLGLLPSGYSLRGQINWGDGSLGSPAQFVRQADGSVAVLGSHTYSSVGSDDIRVIVAAVPPPGSLAPVRLIGAFHSKATVISANGGVTLEETAGVPFTANVGFFSSALSSDTMTAVIQWGDGTQSLGKILALPTAGPVPTFAVFGGHTYATTGSFLVHVTVYSSSPSPTADPTTPAILVAQIDSVIDSLPPLPTAAPALTTSAIRTATAVTV